MDGVLIGCLGVLLVWGIYIGTYALLTWLALVVLGFFGVEVSWGVVLAGIILITWLAGLFKR